MGNGRRRVKWTLTNVWQPNQIIKKALQLHMDTSTFWKQYKAPYNIAEHDTGELTKNR